MALDPLPDLVAFQEVWRPAYAELLMTALQSEYFPIDVPRGGALGRLGGLLVMVHRTGGWNVNGECFAQFEAHAPWLKFWQGDGLAKKGLQSIDLDWNGVPIRLVNTHLQSQYRLDRYVKIRGAQLGELNIAAQEQLAPGTPALIVGDFNTTPAEPLIPDEFRTWRDLTTELRETSPKLKTNDTDGWIDYALLHSGRCRFEEHVVDLLPSRTGPNNISDHRGLTVRVKLECP